MSISKHKFHKVAKTRIYIKDPTILGYMARYNTGYMARYNTSKKSSRKSAYRKPAARPYKRARTWGGSFASQVRKANLNSAQSKNVSACFMNHALHHNRWYKGRTVTGQGDAAVTPFRFENMFADMTHGTNDHQRVGDEIYLEKLSLRLFLSSPATVGSCITYHIIVYYTAN